MPNLLVGRSGPYGSLDGKRLDSAQHLAAGSVSNLAEPLLQTLLEK